MRKMSLAVVLIAAACFVAVGHARKYGRPYLVTSSSNVLGTVGRMAFVIRQEAWPKVWDEPLEYSTTMVGDPSKLMLMAETITLTVDGTRHVILECWGIMVTPEPKTECRSPLMGVQPPELIKVFRSRMHVWRILAEDSKRQRDDAARELSGQPPEELPPTKPTMY